MVRQHRHLLPAAAEFLPVRLEVEFPVGRFESVKEMGVLEGKREILPAVFVVLLRVPHAGGAQRLVHDFPGCHVEPAVLRTQPFGQLRNHVVVLAAFGVRLDDFLRHLEVGMPARGVHVVVLEEGRRRQHDVGESRGLGHELLVYAGEKVFPREALVHEVELRAHHRRIGVLHDDCSHRRPALERFGVTRQDRPEPRLVEFAQAFVDHVGAVDQVLLQRVEGGLPVQCPAAQVPPRAGHGRQAGHRMHVGRAVARARKAVMAADVAFLRRAIEARKRDDLFGLKAGDLRRPLRCARNQVRGQLVRRIGVLAQVLPVREAFLEQHVHHRAGKRAVGAGFQREVNVGLRRGAGAIRVHHDQFRAAFPCGHRVSHHVDLRVDRIAAPDHHEVGVLVDFAHVHTALEARTRHPARVGQRHADGREPARIFELVAQEVDPVTLHEAHRAGVVVRPHRLGAVQRGLLLELLGDRVERLFPRDARELFRAFRARALQRMPQAVGVMHALGVAGDLLADHAVRVSVAHRAAHAADGVRVPDLHLERAGAGAVVGADRGADA